jgi:hypothetical protein
MIRAQLMIVVAVALAIAAPVSALVQEKKGKDKETELHRNMEAMDTGLHALKASVKDATKNAESLATVVEMQAAAQVCKTQTPKMTAEVPEAERAGFVKSYRKQIIVLQQKLLELETALLDGDQAKSEELYRALKKLEEDGHEKFTNE